MVAISQNIVNSLTGSTLDIQKLATDLVGAVRAPQQAAIDAKKTLATSKISSVGKIVSSANLVKQGLATYGDPKSLAFKVGTDPHASFQFHYSSPARRVDFSFQVNQPATANTVMLAGMTSDGVLAGADGSGVLNIYSGLKPTDPAIGKSLVASFNLADYATLGDLQAAVQQTTGFDASIVSSGSGTGSLQYLSISHGMGADNKFFVETVNGDGVALTDGLKPKDEASSQSNGVDCIVTYNGVTFNSPKNQFSDLVSDLNITIDPDTPPNTNVHLTTTSNTDASKQALQDIVTAYNELLGSITTEIKYDKDITKRGGLANNSVAKSFLNQMRSLTTDPINLGGGKSATLADIGVRTNLDGTLTLDTAQLTKVMASSPGLLESVVGSGVSAGALERVQKLADVVVGPTSSFQAIMDSATKKDLPKIEDEITALNEKMDALQAKYLTQFSAMQAIVNSSKSTQDSLTQSMASWTAGLKG